MTNHGQVSVTDPQKPAHKIPSGLRPWKKGQSGNPGGRRKDGKPQIHAVLGTQAFRDALNQLLGEPGRLPELARALFKLALEGNGPAWQHLLARLDPIKDDQSGRKVLEGLTLEISREGVKLQLPTQTETITPVETTGCVTHGEPALLPQSNGD